MKWPKHISFDGKKAPLSFKPRVGRSRSQTCQVTSPACWAAILRFRSYLCVSNARAGRILDRFESCGFLALHSSASSV
jgi:hypothetical protein